MSDDSQGSRLPPPAFPPGSRKHIGANNNAKEHSVEGMGEGFISPDDPIPARHDEVDDAFISPDEPLPERPQEIVEAGYSMAEGTEGAEYAFPDFGTEGGVVTSMGDDDHMDPEELASGGDPYVLELIEKVGKLAGALRAKGEAGLRTSPGMDKFEATLRGYCVGYLAGRRAQDDPSAKDY